MRAVLALGVAFAMLFAGCLTEEGGASAKQGAAKGLGGKGALPVGLGLVPVEVGIWDDPQTAPHPLYNFPTLSHPPAEIKNEWLRPIPMGKMPASISGLDGVAQVKGTTSGAGMSLIGGIAILPSGTGTRFVDIRDPTAPVVVGEVEGGTRGSDTIVYPDGRIVAVVATGSGVIFLIDITNPALPAEPVQIKVPEGSRTHKVDVVPGTPIIYNSASREIYDASDPLNPVLLKTQMPAACHRTYFYIEPSEEYYRAICAGYEYTHLWDITNPSEPKVVKSIPMWHANDDVPASSRAPATFSHFAILNDDHTVLIVGDEMGGGAAMACGATVPTPLGDKSTPAGALWFFDVSDEQNPELLAWLAPPTPAVENPATSCTAHHGRLVPDPEGKRDLLAMGFYGAGVVLIDFTDASSPVILDQFNPAPSSVWEAWYYNGYVFTGDGRRGLDAIGFR